MKRLTLYTPYEHVPCGTIDAIESMEITHKSVEPGEIRITCGLDDTGKLLCKDMLVWMQGDNTAFILTTVDKSKDKWGKETVEARGACLKWLLSKRVFPLTKVFKGTVGAVMNQCYNAVTDTEARVFPRMSINIDETMGEEITIETGQDNLKSVLEDICEAEGLKMWISFDPNTRDMALYAEQGNDYSKESTGKTVVIDSDYEAIANVEYTESTADHANVMYITDSANAVLEEGETEKAGFARYEAAMSASTGKTVTNANGSTTTLTTAQYTEKKKLEAKAELEKMAVVQSVEGDLDTENKLLTFGHDYDLGDVVTVRVRAWGVESNVRVKEERTKYEKSKTTQSLTLGNPLPTLADRIQKIQKKAGK